MASQTTSSNMFNQFAIGAFLAFGVVLITRMTLREEMTVGEYLGEDAVGEQEFMGEQDFAGEDLIGEDMPQSFLGEAVGPLEEEGPLGIAKFTKAKGSTRSIAGKVSGAPLRPGKRIQYSFNQGPGGATASYGPSMKSRFGRGAPKQRSVAPLPQAVPKAVAKAVPKILPAPSGKVPAPAPKAVPLLKESSPTEVVVTTRNGQIIQPHMY